MPTNHVDRIDIRHEFKKCSRSIIHQMITHFFADQHSEKSETVNVNELVDNYYSPGDVVQACMRSTTANDAAIYLHKHSDHALRLAVHMKEMTPRKKLLK